MPKSESPTMEVNETPAGPVLEVVEKAPVKPLTEKQLLKKISKLEDEIVKCDPRQEVFEVQLAKLEANKKKAEIVRDEEISEILDKNQNCSDQQALEEILKMSTPKLDQLEANVTKVKVSVLKVKRKRHKLHLEVKELEKQLSDINADREAKATFEGVGAFLDAYKAAEKAFNDLKDKAMKCTDIRYASRAGKLGFSPSFEVIADSYLKPANLPRLSMRELVDMIADLADAYGPVLIEKDFDRMNDVPLVREKFIADYGGIGTR